MELTFLGHACFRLKGKEVTLLTDPFDPSVGYAWPRPQARIVLVSHAHPGHSYTAGVEGEPRVVASPGEYEISGVFIQGLATYHDQEQGKKLGKNTIFLIDMEELRVLHLGDLGHPLSPEVAGRLGRIDVLLVPVGGGPTINARVAAGLIRSLEPRLVIPMHYRTEVWGQGLDPVLPFLKEMGVGEAAAQPRLSVTRSSLPTEPKVVVLDHPRP